MQLGPWARYCGTVGKPGGQPRTPTSSYRLAYTYLVDVLQRISEHPASRVSELTPREWKVRFSSNPMKSDLALTQQ